MGLPRAAYCYCWPFDVSLKAAGEGRSAARWTAGIAGAKSDEAGKSPRNLIRGFELT